MEVGSGTIAVRAIRTAVRAVEHLANLERAVIGLTEHVDVELHEFLAQFDGFFLRCRLQDREAADQFLRFGERPVGYGHLASGNAHPSPRRAGKQAAGLKEDAGFGHLFTEFAHRRDQGRIGWLSCFEAWIRLDYHHESHCYFSLTPWGVESPAAGNSFSSRSAEARFDIARRKIALVGRRARATNQFSVLLDVGADDFSELFGGSRRR